MLDVYECLLFLFFLINMIVFNKGMMVTADMFHALSLYFSLPVVR